MKINIEKLPPNKPHAGTSKPKINPVYDFIRRRLEKMSMSDEHGILKFARTHLKACLVLLLWFTVIAQTVAGGVIGYHNAPQSTVEFANHNGNIWRSSKPNLFNQIVCVIAGGAIGFTGGMFTVVIIGGLAVTFLNIDKNIQKIADKP